MGLYHNPPEKAVVLCVDEKSQIQALNRSQPVLPMMPGMPERRTHDYERNGITTLFAAFDIADGSVISELHRRHRATEFKKFLVTIDKTVPEGLAIHVVCDNYGTYKTPAIRDWLAAHPRVRLALGSHNLRSIAHGIACLPHFGLGGEDIELQVLRGLGEDIGTALAGMRLRVRVYSPVGDLVEGMAYLVRRMLENTANDSFLAARARGAPVEQLLAQP